MSISHLRRLLDWIQSSPSMNMMDESSDLSNAASQVESESISSATIPILPLIRVSLESSTPDPSIPILPSIKGVIDQADSMANEDDVLMIGVRSHEIQVKSEPIEQTEMITPGPSSPSLELITSKTDSSIRRLGSKSAVTPVGWLYPRRGLTLDAARTRSQLQFEEEACRRMDEALDDEIATYLFQQRCQPIPDFPPVPFDEITTDQKYGKLFEATFEVESVDDFKIEFDPETDCEELFYKIHWKGFDKPEDIVWQYAENPCNYEELLDELEKRSGKAVPRVGPFIAERDAKKAQKSQQSTTSEVSSKKRSRKTKTESHSQSSAKRPRSSSTKKATPSDESKPKRMRTKQPLTAASVTSTASHASSSTSSEPLTSLTTDSDTETEDEGDMIKPAATRQASTTSSSSSLNATPSSQPLLRASSASSTTTSTSASSTSETAATPIPSKSPSKRRKSKGLQDEWKILPEFNYPAFHFQSAQIDVPYIRQAKLRYNHYFPNTLTYKPLTSALQQLLTTYLPGLNLTSRTAAFSLTPALTSRGQPTKKRTSNRSTAKFQSSDIVVKQEPGLAPAEESKTGNEMADDDEKMEVDDDANEDEDEDGGRPLRVPNTRSIDAWEERALKPTTAAAGATSRIQASPLSVNEIRIRLDLIKRVIHLGYAIPQAVFEWLLNRILDPSDLIDCGASNEIYAALTSLLTTHPQWFLLTDHHLQLLHSIVRFVKETLPLFVLHPLQLAPESMMSAQSIGGGVGSALPYERKKRQYYLAQLTKYLLVVRFLYVLFAHDLKLTQKFNLLLKDIHQQQQHPSSTATAPPVSPDAARLYQSAIDSTLSATVAGDLTLDNTARSRSRRSATIQFKSLLRECSISASSSSMTFLSFQRDILVNLEDQLLALMEQYPMQVQHEEEAIPPPIPFVHMSNWFEAVNLEWLEIILQMEKAKL